MPQLPSALNRVLPLRPDNLSGLVAWWPFLGNSALDQSGNNINGVKGSAMRWNPTPYGPGFTTFNNATGTITATAVGAATGTNFTWSFWLYQSSQASATGLFGNTSGNGTCFTNAAATWKYVGGTGTVSSSSVMVAGRWSHMAVTSTTSGTVIKLYTNGVQVGSGTVTAPTFGTMNLGGPFLQSNGYQFADFRAYNRALSAAEVYMIYAAGNMPPELEPMALKTAFTLNSMAAAPASFAFTPSAATLLLKRNFAAAPASFAFTPAAETSLIKRNFIAAPGSFAFTPSAAALKTVRRLAAAPGVFTFTPSPATLKTVRRLGAAPAAFSINAGTATLHKVGGATTFSMAAAPASFVVTGSSAAMKAVRRLPAAPAAFTFSAGASTLTPIHYSPVSGVMAAVWTASATATPGWAAQGSAAMAVTQQATMGLVVAQNTTTAGWSI